MEGGSMPPWPRGELQQAGTPVTRPSHVQRHVPQVPLKQEEAESARDALAKAVYGKLFSWIVTQINTALIDKDTKLDDTGFLGILDIIVVTIPISVMTVVISFL